MKNHSIEILSCKDKSRNKNRKRNNKKTKRKKINAVSLGITWKENNFNLDNMTIQQNVCLQISNSTMMILNNNSKSSLRSYKPTIDAFNKEFEEGNLYWSINYWILVTNSIRLAPKMIKKV